tara:strand:+ start:1976 stop:2194 length:219 start_codon:yes stop_codon:yes gene_type:complete
MEKINNILESDKIVRYGHNCISIGTKIYSYETHVADISDTLVTELGWWSKTTSKHVTIAANALGLTLVKYKR